MKTYRKDCFAIVEPEDFKNGKVACRALGKLDCEGCRFYKPKDKVKNNVFYKDSYDSIGEYNEAVKEYKSKYQQNNYNSLTE